MITNLIAWIQHSVISLGVFGAFGASFLQEIIWFIPSTIIQASLGFFAFQGVAVSFVSISTFIFKICIPAALGVVVGTIPFYLLAYYGGGPLLYRYGPKIGIKKSLIETSERFLSEKKYGHSMLFLSRTIPIIPSTTVTIIFGLLRVKLFPYLLYTFLGTIPRVFVLGFLGWQFGLGYRAVLLSIFS